MGLLEILTIIFVVCKLAGVITWSWWLVFSPILVAVGLYVIIFVGYVIAALKLKGNAEKSFKDFEEKMSLQNRSKMKPPSKNLFKK